MPEEIRTGGSAEEIRLVELDDGLSCWATSEAEARFIHREIFQDDTYRRIELPEAPVVVDVGANIGLFTLFVKRLRPAARVIAVEPAPGNLRVLRRNVELHGLDGVTIHPVGLGARPEDAVPMAFYPRLPGNSTLHPDKHDLQRALMSRQLGAEQAARLFEAREIPVPVDRLSGLLRTAHPDVTTIDLVKIDVEGAESAVLAGVDAEDRPRIRALLVEVGGPGGDRQDVERTLRGWGLRVTRHRAPFMWDELELYNVLAQR
ncbi:FkbM family methyltransferase [Micromonospora sp. NPDC002296]|uniref:FkbM family methyltransferase n=1 Tax=Micromonospora sp. NPDC002296 TaxID=3154271 RepID=UPI0033204149